MADIEEPSKPTLFNEADGTKRFLAEFAKIKAAHNLTNYEFLNSIGYNAGGTMTDIISGRIYVNLRMLVNTKLVYPELDLDYIFFSKEVPEVIIPNEMNRPKSKYTKHKERAPRRTKEQIRLDREKFSGK